MSLPITGLTPSTAVGAEATPQAPLPLDVRLREALHEHDHRPAADEAEEAPSCLPGHMPLPIPALSGGALPLAMLRAGVVAGGRTARPRDGSAGVPAGAAVALHAAIAGAGQGGDTPGSSIVASSRRTHAQPSASAAGVMAPRTQAATPLPGPDASVPPTAMAAPRAAEPGRPALPPTPPDAAPAVDAVERPVPDPRPAGGTDGPRSVPAPAPAPMDVEADVDAGRGQHPARRSTPVSAATGADPGQAGLAGRQAAAVAGSPPVRRGADAPAPHAPTPPPAGDLAPGPGAHRSGLTAPATLSVPFTSWGPGHVVTAHWAAGLAGAAQGGLLRGSSDAGERALGLALAAGTAPDSGHWRIAASAGSDEGGAGRRPPMPYPEEDA